MGYWGTYIVARSSRPIMELNALRASAEQLAWRGVASDGWQVAQIHRGPEGWESTSLPAEWEHLLVAVMEQTGHPVLAAVVMASDGAQLIGFSPKAGRWGGWLELDSIIGHIIPEAWPYFYEDENGEMQPDEGEDYQRRRRAAEQQMHAVGPPAPLAAPLAVQWATEAGFTSNIAAVQAVLDGGEVFVEDLFFRLLETLGLPEFADAKS